MSFFKRRERKGADGATALAERPRDEFNGDDNELAEEIARLLEENRTSPNHDRERRLIQLRNIKGCRRLAAGGATPEHPEPAFDQLPQGAVVPEVHGRDLSPELIRAGILRSGCLLVRELVPREQALRFAGGIDRAFAERDRHDEGQPYNDGLYSEFTPDKRFGEELARPWIKEGGGVLAVDSPSLNFEMFEMFGAAGLPGIIERYLGESPLMTAQKTTLRKAEPAVPGGWHQDGKFMGPVRALNLWLSLSRCGDEAPGLDIIPRRLDGFVVTQTEEAMLDYMISQARAEETAGEAGIHRPIFEPGDALFFDDLFLHKTGSDPSMPKPRYAIESWFFGASLFPVEYAPLAV